MPNVIRTPAEAVFVTMIVVVVSMLVISMALIAATLALPKELEAAGGWGAILLPPLTATIVLARLSAPSLRRLVGLVGAASTALGFGLLVLVRLMMPL